MSIIATVEPVDAQCLRMEEGVRFAVAPRPRKRLAEAEDDEDQPSPLRSCLLRIQPALGFGEGLQDVLIHPETMRTLRWRPGNVISITALRKPFSFGLLDQQMRQTNKKVDDKSFISKAQRMVRYVVRENAKVAPLHVVLPLHVQLYCLGEDRTRILVRFVMKGTRTLKKVTPKRIVLHEIRWMSYG